MRADARGVAAACAGAATVAALAYGALALARIAAFARRRVHPSGEPAITILKPLHGADAQLEDNLRSFCRQNYGSFEVIFGARDADDAALDVARRVADAFPACARVVTGDGPRYANPKIDTLSVMLPQARHEIVAIADSDMRVDADYLPAVAAAFADPRVGAVTCPYRGAGAGGAASMLGAMRADEHFTPSVLVAEALGPLRYCFGSTMAVRRAVLERIGGLAALGGHVADDALLGALVADAGYRVALAPYVVENRIHEPNVRALWLHEVRWARTNRALRPHGYALLFITYPIPLALAYAALARRRGRALLALAAAGALRFALAAAARRAFGVTERRAAWMVPVRDVLGLAIWAAAYTTRDVRWGRTRLALARDGRLESAAYTASAS